MSDSERIVDANFIFLFFIKKIIISAPEPQGERNLNYTRICIAVKPARKGNKSR